MRGERSSWKLDADGRPIPTSQAARAPNWYLGTAIWPARRRLLNTVRIPTVWTTAGT